MTTTKPFQLGTVISGTLRPEDLLPAFAGALYDIGDSQHPLVLEANKLIVRNWPDSTDKPSEEEMSTLLEQLDLGLSECCPPFVYFGAHPGDGADFGFWPDWEALDETFGYAELPYPMDGEWHLPQVIVVLANEGESLAVMDLDRQVLWSTV